MQNDDDLHHLQERQANNSFMKQIQVLPSQLLLKEDFSPQINDYHRLPIKQSVTPNQQLFKQTKPKQNLTAIHSAHKKPPQPDPPKRTRNNNFINNRPSNTQLSSTYYQVTPQLTKRTQQSFSQYVNEQLGQTPKKPIEEYYVNLLGHKQDVVENNQTLRSQVSGKVPSNGTFSSHTTQQLRTLLKSQQQRNRGRGLVSVEDQQRATMSPKINLDLNPDIPLSPSSGQHYVSQFKILKLPRSPKSQLAQRISDQIEEKQSQLQIMSQDRLFSNPNISPKKVLKDSLFQLKRNFEDGLLLYGLMNTMTSSSNRNSNQLLKEDTFSTKQNETNESKNRPEILTKHRAALKKRVHILNNDIKVVTQ